MNRRSVLGGTVVALLAAGCGSDRPSGGPGDSTDATATPGSTERPRTTDTTESNVPTNTCDDQPILPDVRIRNERPTERTIPVTVFESDTVFFSEQYTVEGGDGATESDRIYRDAQPSQYGYRLSATLGEQTAETDVTTVARNPTLYGVVVSVEETVSVRPVHADPGPEFNPNCY